MRTIWSILSIISIILGALALIAAETLSMANGNNIPEGWYKWGLILFVIGVGLPTIITQSEQLFNSKIYLAQHGIQKDKALLIDKPVKTFWRKKIEKVRVEFPAFYIALANHPRWGHKSIDGIMPHISWYDSNGKLVERNNGRWWLSNVSTYQDTSILQSINLEPNGQIRLLHLARYVNGQLLAWYRTQDNKEPYSPLEEGEYHVEVNLQSNSGPEARFDFIVTYRNGNLSFARVTGLRAMQKRFNRKNK